MNVIHVPVFGEPVEVTLDDYRVLEGLQKLVGGFIEIVRTEELQNVFGKGVVMVVNEEGLIKGLEQNYTMRPFYRGEYGIAGNAVLIGEGLVECVDEEGDTYMDMDFMDVPLETYILLNQFLNR